MNDLETVNKIITNAVENSSYITVIISSCVFILYTLIIQIVNYYKQKSKDKPLIEMASAIKESSNNIVKLNAILDKTFKDAERKEIAKCKTVIELAFANFKSKICQQCEAIIAHNNIDKNKELIVNNINKTVSTEYYKLYSTLSAYEVNEVNVASKLKEDWIKEIATDVIAIIYNNQDALSRITQLNNRLIIYIEDYSTFINNKTFNT